MIRFGTGLRRNFLLDLARKEHTIQNQTNSSVSKLGKDCIVTAPPVFIRDILNHLDTLPKIENVLDMTFGVGGHSKAILDKFPLAKVIAADLDSQSINLAKTMSEDHRFMDRILPVKSRFSNLAPKLVDMGFGLRSLDAIILETGLSSIQKKQQGLYRPDETQSGLLDFRADPDLKRVTPSASEVLQNISETSLFKLLKNYGGAKQSPKYITNAIVEARYMFNTFQTIEDLRDALSTSASRMSTAIGRDQSELLSEMMRETLRALSYFVNDDLNELHFALQVVAESFIKPDGLLFVIANSDPQLKVIEQVLTRKQFYSVGEGVSRLPWSLVEEAKNHPWTLDTLESISLNDEEIELNPILADTKLIISARSHHNRLFIPND